MNLRELLKLYEELSTIALTEFADIVEATRMVENKLRIFLVDGSYIDVWFSIRRPGVFAYHWERRGLNGTIYRYDNIPDRRARGLPTFPKHFHEDSEDNIVGRDFGEKPHDVLRNFLNYVREKLRGEKIT